MRVLVRITGLKGATGATGAAGVEGEGNRGECYHVRGLGGLPCRVL